MVKNLLLAITFVIAPAVGLDAVEPGPAVIDSLVNQLGADQFLRRVEAERALTEQGKRHPKVVRALLQERLADEDDPEIRSRLQKLLRLVPRSAPQEEVVFSKAALDAKTWEFFGDPPKKARYTMKNGVLEIDSLGEVADAMGFVHRFPKPVVAEKAFRFGPRPNPKPQRLVLDAEIKVLEQSVIRSGLAGVHLNLEDHRTSAGLMILPDRIFLYRHKEAHHMDTTDRWHHYRFVIEGDREEIFVDDMEKPVLTVNRSKGVGRHWATFGDGTAGAGARAQIRNVRVSRFAIDPKK